MTKKATNLKNKIILESLSMDLLRVALGVHRGSTSMAKKFEEEAMARTAEVDKKSSNLTFKTFF